MRIWRVRRPEWTIGAGGAILLASMLALPWYAGSVDGWHGLHHARWLMVVTVALALSVLVMQMTMRGPAVPVTLTLICGLLGGISSLWLIYRVLISPPGGDRMVGGFIGLLGVGAIAYGAWRSMRLEGIAPEDAPAHIPVVDPARPD